MFGEPVLQFEIHVGMPQKSLIFKVILTPVVGVRGFAAFWS